MPIKAYYHAPIQTFIADDSERLLGVLTAGHHHSLEEQQRWAWTQQISILKSALSGVLDGHVFLEFYIPRMGKRADAVLVGRKVVLVIEFKAGAAEYSAYALDQVEDYALDLKNFHEGSHSVPVIPLLVSTRAEFTEIPEILFDDDLVAKPIATNGNALGSVIAHILAASEFTDIDLDEWMSQGYRPTPTIIEAAQVLYQSHSVADISRFDAGAINLEATSSAVASVIDQSRQNRQKSICFITGVPGSGKTLAGLNIATRRSDQHADEHAVFLSGNGPLVSVLREALARDKARREDIAKKTAEREVRSFIQNIHHFRDEYLSNPDIPIEKVVVFDEAQRAWTRQQAARFMQRKRGQLDFDMSEPEFLLSVMDRHHDWCTVVCLVGEGQEINTGEAGITEWINALRTRFANWEVHISSRLSLDSTGTSVAETSIRNCRFQFNECLHLAVSMRSFRAERLSDFVGHVLHSDAPAARSGFESIRNRYPIRLTRSLQATRDWLRRQSRGTERIGLVASSGALRLKPEGIHVKADVEPPNWFLNDKSDVRSSWYLEDVASEFDVQGLELDWVGVCWDGDFHHDGANWKHQSFSGSRWLAIRESSRQDYLKNAYRVLLTRARQGMVIFIPKVGDSDLTRRPSYYDGTFDFLRLCGIPLLEA